MADFSEWTFTALNWNPTWGFTPSGFTATISPQWLIGSDGVDWSGYPKIKIACLAFGDSNSVNMKDARNYVAMFFSLSSEIITNEPLYKGGTDMQTSPANRYLTITEGNNSGRGAILAPKMTEKSYAKIGNMYYINKLGIYTESVIEFDLEVELQLPNNIHP